MDNVFGFVSEAEFLEQMNKANTYLRYIAAGVGVGYKPTTPAEINGIVRSGRHKEMIPVGSQIISSRNGVSIVWDVIGHNQDTPADPQYTNSLTIYMHEIFDFVQFCAPQAMYYAEEALAPGTYNVTPMNGWSGGMGNGKTYQFTLTKTVPKGGQIVWNGAWDQDPLKYKINTYSSAVSTTVIESVSPTEGSGGTALTVLNNAQRMCYGSNRYLTSAIRQWANSDKPAGSVWTPQDKYDRPPIWVNDKDGFLRGLDSDFLSIIGQTKKKTARCRLAEEAGMDETSDRFFLLSRSEMYMGDEYSDNHEGDPYTYFVNYSDNPSANTGKDKNRIKYKNGSPQWFWQRTPSSGYANTVRYVSTEGRLDNNGASNAYGAVLACNVI